MTARKRAPMRRGLASCGCVLMASFAIGYAVSAPATQFGDDDNCGPITNGTSGADTYFMGGGNDCASMFDGPDYVDGQNGNDGTLEGGYGGDQVLGSGGGDTLHDHNGIDDLKGGTDGDIVSGYDGSGGDTVNGGGGADYCSWDGGDSQSGCTYRFFD